MKVKIWQVMAKKNVLLQRLHKFLNNKHAYFFFITLLFKNINHIREELIWVIIL
jgi:hypothetical protein